MSETLHPRCSGTVSYDGSLITTKEYTLHSCHPNLHPAQNLNFEKTTLTPSAVIPPFIADRHSHHRLLPFAYLSSNAFLIAFFASSRWVGSLNVSLLTEPLSDSSSSMYRVGRRWA